MIPKFRVWDSKEQRMLYPGDYTMEIDKWGVHIHGNNNQVISVDEREDVMQSTNFYDKDNVEVFEGDVVRFKFPYDRRQKALGVIVHRKDKACFGIYTTLTDEEYELYRITAKHHFEVIGNKHENPELIKMIERLREDAGI
ncbi:YopX protein [Staphylococcus microti]|uniref:YopX protein n=1 Tax=Staphylococcus microti TaxID=569857 RepID=A0A380GU19_9STAP|nr:YopX family protein [Staphylococcus microti]PNZ82473.1 hypothetical protein CD132_04035 [Staphylococcus microti]PNZ83658.1 hypothetical protein CD132_01905 [Staphylococcus microti]SUM57037.1 YopX protein [Staphylococcus microti]